MMRGLCLLAVFFVEFAASSQQPLPGEPVTPGVSLSRLTQYPQGVSQRIYILHVNLRDPKVRFAAGLAGETALTREIVRVQADRQGALAAINADFGAVISGDDFPQGMTVQNGELITSPKFRTGLGITAGNEVYIGKWQSTQPPAWAWPALATAPNGQSHHIMHYNQACEAGWLSLYSHRYNDPPRSPAHRWPDAAQALLSAQGDVIQLATQAQELSIPPGGMALVGRGGAATWLTQNLSPGDRISLDLRTTPDWRQYHTIVGGGPRVLRDGAFHADPAEVYNGAGDIEDFELSYKQNYYTTRQPRTAVGVSAERDRLLLVVADGRTPNRAGLTLRELADLLLEHGAHDALQFDGGGSSTMVLHGEVLNRPSDGRERAVTNSLLLFYE